MLVLGSIRPESEAPSLSGSVGLDLCWKGNLLDSFSGRDDTKPLQGLPARAFPAGVNADSKGDPQIVKLCRRPIKRDWWRAKPLRNCQKSLGAALTGR